MKIKQSIFGQGSLKDLGFNLYMLRHTKGMSLKELSQKIGFTEAELEKMELGRYPKDELVDLEKVFKIINFFNAKIEISILD